MRMCIHIRSYFHSRDNLCTGFVYISHSTGLQWVSCVKRIIIDGASNFKMSHFQVTKINRNSPPLQLHRSMTADTYAEPIGFSCGHRAPVVSLDWHWSNSGFVCLSACMKGSIVVSYMNRKSVQWPAAPPPLRWFEFLPNFFFLLECLVTSVIPFFCMRLLFSRLDSYIRFTPICVCPFFPVRWPKEPPPFCVCSLPAKDTIDSSFLSSLANRVG